MARITVACALCLCLLDGGAGSVRAQDTQDSKPLIVYLDEEQTRYVKFGTSMQIWARYTDLNPGSSISENGAVQSGIADVSIRRFRASMDAQLTGRTMGYIQIGLNNLNYRSSRGTPVELLDIYAEYKASDAFSFGGGKSLWHGVSRYSSPSTTRMLTLDLPLVALPTINITDDLLRHVGVWAKGRISRLEYRAALFTPFTVEGSTSFDPDPEEGVAKFTDDGLDHALGSSAYLKWQFYEKESNRLPFAPGTYLGQKKVLNIGVGYEIQTNRTVHLELDEPVFNDLKLWAVDAFADLPVNREKRTAVTIYAAVFNYDFGPDYIRNVGANNPAGGLDPDQAAFNGAGNAYPILGTGRTMYVQAGFLFPPMGHGGGLGQLQPFADFQSSDFERLDDRMNAWSAGINWLFRGHDSKATLGLQSRPIYFQEGDRIEVHEHKSMIVLQYQLRMS